MKKCKCISVAVAAVACFATTSADATGEAPVVATVTGQGVGTFSKDTDYLRVEVRILAQGSTLSEAISNVRPRVAAARQQLTGFGASEDAIEEDLPTPVRARTESGPFPFPPPGIIQSEPLSPVPALPPPSREGVRAKSKVVKPSSSPSTASSPSPPVASRPTSIPPVVAVALKVDIPLNAKTPDKLFRKADQLKAQVIAAGLSGIKELEVRAQDLDLPSCGSCKTEPGDPGFLFVAKFRPEERERALADAFRAARQEAALLAKAAGSEFGPLVSLSHQSKTDSDAHPNIGLPALGLIPRKADEASSLTPARLTYRASVVATFSLRPADRR